MPTARATPLQELVSEINFADVLPGGQTMTVTTPGGTPVVTTGIWLTPSSDGSPAAADLQRNEPRQGLALRRSDVPAAPRGTTISVAGANEGDPPDIWRVDAADLAEADHLRVIVSRVNP